MCTNPHCQCGKNCTVCACEHECTDPAPTPCAGAVAMAISQERMAPTAPTNETPQPSYQDNE